jgi:hypothetical protein
MNLSQLDNLVNAWLPGLGLEGELDRLGVSKRLIRNWGELVEVS